MRTGFWSYTSIIIQIFLAIITFVYGIGVTIFYLKSENYNSSLWAIFAAAFAFAIIHLHVLFLRNDLDDWYDPESFHGIKVLVQIFLLVGTVGFIYNLTSAISNKEYFDVHGHYASSILAFILIFWCLVICICTRKYKRYVEMCIPISPSKA